MKIQNIETFLVERFVIVRVTTDTGIQGIGEATFWAMPKASEAAVTAFKDDLIGMDPANAHCEYTSARTQQIGMDPIPELKSYTNLRRFIQSHNIYSEIHLKSEPIFGYSSKVRIYLQGLPIKGGII